MSHNWGYKQAQKDAAAMGFGSGGTVKVTGYERKAPVRMATGGPVKSDAAQDRAMMSRHNKLMHPGQKSKLAAGGMVKPAPLSTPKKPTMGMKKVGIGKSICK